MSQDSKPEDTPPNKKKHALEVSENGPDKKIKRVPNEDNVESEKSEAKADKTFILNSPKGLNSPKDFKNVSINLILNVRGVAIQQSDGAKSDLKDSETSITPTSPKLLNSKAPSTTPSSLSSQSNHIDKLIDQGHSPGLSSSTSLPQIGNLSKSGTKDDSHPQNSGQSSGPISTNSYPSSAPIAFSHVPGAHLYGTPISSQPGMAAGQPILGTGAQMHHLDFHPLQHQTHLGQDLDPLHESKRGRRFRRRYNQIIRRYSCSFPGCSKSYGSLNHLNTHIVTKKHGHRKSKADFQHNQFPNGEQDPINSQGSLYGEHGSYSPMAPPLVQEYPGNYWYNYRHQGISQPPLSNQHTHLPHQPIPAPLHSGAGLPPPPPPPPQVSGLGYYYYPPGYQQVPPPPGQQASGVAWGSQQPMYPIYPSNPGPYLAHGNSSNAHTPLPPPHPASAPPSAAHAHSPPAPVPPSQVPAIQAPPTQTQHISPSSKDLPDSENNSQSSK